MNETTDLISIIVPVYNVREYLDKCIKSCINQSYFNIEVLLINDGSNDGSEEICKKYLYDNRVKFINNDNHGLSYSRQFGIDIARGKYICSVDSDDYMDSTMIEKMYVSLKNSDSDVCVCGRIDIFEKYEKNVPVTNNEILLNMSKSDIETNFYNLTKVVFSSDTWNKLYRASFVKNSGVRFDLPNNFNGTDLQFNGKLLLHCPRYVVLKDCLYYHRILEGSRVRKKGKDLQGAFNLIICSFVKQAKTMGYSETIYKQFKKYYIDLCYAAIFDKLWESDSIKTIYYDSMDFVLKHQKLVRKNSFFHDMCLADTHSRYILKESVFYLIHHGHFFILSSFFYVYHSLRKLKRRFII